MEKEKLAHQVLSVNHYFNERRTSGNDAIEITAAFISYVIGSNCINGDITTGVANKQLDELFSTMRTNLKTMIDSRDQSDTIPRG